MACIFWSYPASASQSAKLVYARASEADSCGEESSLRQAVARRLGYDPFVAVSDNTVVAELRGDGEGLRARVFVIERGNAVGGVRELTSKSRHCDELMLAVALAISIAIDPESIDRVVDVTSEASPEPVPQAKPVELVVPAPAKRLRKPAPPPTPPPEAAGPLGIRFGVGAFFATGPAPFPSLGLAGDVELAAKKWSIGLEPRWLPATESAPLPSSGATAKTSLLGLTLAPCYRINAWRGCYLAEIGRLDSQGNVASPKRDVSVWAAQGLRIAFHLGAETGFGATAKLDGMVALNRVRLQVDGQPVHETPRLVGRLGLDVNYVF